MVELKHNQKVHRLPTEEEKQWCKEHDFGYYIGSEEVDSGCYSPGDFIYTEEVEYTVFFSNARRAAEIHNENYECEGCGFILLLMLATFLIALFE